MDSRDKSIIREASSIKMPAEITETSESQQRQQEHQRSQQ
jgi:hypothetical protein